MGFVGSRAELSIWKIYIEADEEAQRRVINVERPLRMLSTPECPIPGLLPPDDTAVVDLVPRLLASIKPTDPISLTMLP